jgi:hypothetical protein
LWVGVVDEKALMRNLESQHVLDGCLYSVYCQSDKW